MARDYISGLEIENDMRAHLLLYRETTNTNAVPRQTLCINQAGLVIFSLASFFLTVVSRCNWMLLAASLVAFVPCH